MDNGVVITIATLLVGALAPFISEGLNELAKANGQKALVVVGAVSAVLASAVLFLTGVLTPADVTFATFTHVFTAVFTLATVIFHLFKKALGWDVVR